MRTATPDERRSTTGVLVIGTGAAGLRAAIELAESGHQVLCVGKRRTDDAHSVLAAGGINAALGTMDREDSWQQHAADTIAEAYHLADPATVELLAREAPAAIADLVTYGATLAREPDGRLTQRYFGAHTHRRTCFAGDYTGREIQRILVRRAHRGRRRGARRCLHHAAAGARRSRVRRVRLRPRRRHPAGDPGRCGGPRRGRSHAHLAAVLLASRREHRRRHAARVRRGLSPARHGARPVSPNRNDHPGGVGRHAGHRSRARRRRDAAQRGRGALHGALRPRANGALHPRSGRARQLHRDRRGSWHAGGRRPAGVTHLDRETILKRLPRMYRQFVDVAMLDITQTPMEVAPTAHYSMGGVWVHGETHQTDVEGLFAVGECATGLHGANRLGGNSLAECLVFGKIVGAEAARWSMSLDVQVRDRGVVAAAADEVDELLAQRGGAEFARPLQRAIRDLMSEHAGVVRSERGLERGRARLDEIADRIGTMEVRPDIAGFEDLAHAFDLKGSVLAARATLDCALARRETRGAHNRSDFPAQDAGLAVNLIWRQDEPVGREAVGEPSPEVAALVKRHDEIPVGGRLLE